MSAYGRLLAMALGALCLAACGPTLIEVRGQLDAAPECCARLSDLRYAPIETRTVQVFPIGPSNPVFRFETGRSPFAAFELPRTTEALRLTVESYMQTSLQSPTAGETYFFAPRLMLLDAERQALRVVESRSRVARYVPVSEFAATGGVGWKIVLRADLEPGDGARFAVVHTTDHLLGEHTRVPAPRTAEQMANIGHAPAGRLRVGLMPVAATLESVLLLESKPAYAVFAGIPAGKTAAVRDALPADKRDQVRSYPWPAFRAEAQPMLDALFVRNDYPEVDLRRALLELLTEHPATPLGITWNGGIAITAGDYQHAQRQLETFRADPARYDRERPRERRADRLHPLNHLEPLLGW